MRKFTPLSAAFACCVVLGLAVLSGCDPDQAKSEFVQPQGVYQLYAVHYDEQFDQTFASASFHLGDRSGTTVELTGKSSVAHNRVPLRGSDRVLLIFRGDWSYGGSEHGFHADHSFEYTDNAGKTYTNHVAITPVGFAPGTPAEVGRSALTHIAFAGAPVAAGERVTLYVEQSQKIEQPRNGGQPQNPRQVSVSAEATTAGMTEVVLRPQELQILAMGEAQVHWERTAVASPQQVTPRGGEMSALYKTAPRTVQILR